MPQDDFHRRLRFSLLNMDLDKFDRVTLVLTLGVVTITMATIYLDGSLHRTEALGTTSWTRFCMVLAFPSLIAGYVGIAVPFAVFSCAEMYAKAVDLDLLRLGQQVAMRALRPFFLAKHHTQQLQSAVRLHTVTG